MSSENSEQHSQSRDLIREWRQKALPSRVTAFILSAAVSWTVIEEQPYVSAFLLSAGSFVLFLPFIEIKNGDTDD